MGFFILLFTLLASCAVAYIIFFKKPEKHDDSPEHLSNPIIQTVFSDEEKPESAVDRANRIMAARKGHEEPIIFPGSTPLMTAYEQEKDNFESFDFYSAQRLEACGSYRINYTDQRGLSTDREIEVKRIHSSGDDYAIDAHCRMRDSHRSFINSRIKKAVDLETGEVVENVAKHAIAKYDHSAAGRTWTAIQKEFSAVMIMSFVCRADGKMMKAERAIVADYVKRRNPDLICDDTMLEEAIKSLSTPTNKDFRRLIGDLKSNGEYDRIDDLLDCARRIVSTQKTIDPMETAALEILASAAER